MSNSISHNAIFNFKTVTAGTKNAEALEAAIEQGKLQESDVTIETLEDGSQALKRNQLKVTMPVLSADALVNGEVELDSNQVDHLQQILNRYFEDKQKVKVDEFSDDVIDWEHVLSQPYTQRRASVKVTAAMVEAATTALSSALVGKVSEKANAVITSAAGKKFSAAAIRGMSPEVLERIQSAVMEAAEVLDDNGELATHEAVFSLWDANISKALAPAEDDINLDDFM